MRESRRSLAIETAAFILLILFVVLVVPLMLAGPASAASPGPTGYEPPAVMHAPDTSTTTVAVTLTDGGWLSVAVLAGSAAVGLLVTLRRVRR